MSVEKLKTDRLAGFPQVQVEVGNISGLDYLSAFAARVIVDSWARRLLEPLSKPLKTEGFRIVMFKLEDIGSRNPIFPFKEMSRLKKVLANVGLNLCPQLTAPELAFSKTLPLHEDDEAIVLSRPIKDGSNIDFFKLRLHSNILTLNTHNTDRPLHPSFLVVARLK